MMPSSSLSSFSAPFVSTLLALVIASCCCNFLLLVHAQNSSNIDDQQQNSSNISNLDQFTYGDDSLTINNGYPNNIWSPNQWLNVQCPDLETCSGWTEKFPAGIDWQLSENACDWCPADGSGDYYTCVQHHQSPINLERNRAVNESEFFNPCIDVHWMSHFDSTCTWDQLVNYNAFSIERHALKIVQPLELFIPINETTNPDQLEQYRLACTNKGRRFGRIDFSKGYSQWWHLSHLELHVPSEHYQEGRQYDGEMHLYHVYSVSGEVAGVDNQMAAVTFLLDSSSSENPGGYPDYDFLNRIICQWRKVEEDTRQSCGLPSVTTDYPGCYFYQRTFEDTTTTQQSTEQPQPISGRRNLRNQQPDEQDEASTTKSNESPAQKPLSLHDVILHNYIHADNPDVPLKTIAFEPEDYEPADPDFDWDAFIAEQYQHEQARNEIQFDPNDPHHRHLLNYDHVGPWMNYFPLIGVKTEYYFRYSGTQTIPPCYGRFTPGSNRANTNAWRVMKDPIRVSIRQINEIHRLLRDRIAPLNDPLKACQPDTAAKIVDDTKVSTARPLQATNRAHFMTFCECINWGSKWEEDRAWCREKNRTKRFYETPYNYQTKDNLF